MSEGDPSDDRRSGDRRATQRRRGAASDAASPASGSGRDLAPVVTRVESELVDDPATAAAPGGPEAAFAAQIIGQGGQRNGIRGGPPLMDGARSAYLGAEYSGDKERRPPVGKAKRTEI